MLQVVLICPGCTDYVHQGRIQGTLDVPLNDEGSSEVARVIDALRSQRIEVVYAPSCQPTRETAEALAKALDVKLKKLDRMRNLDHGLWQGKRIDDVRRTQPKVYRQWQEQPENVCPPGGEMVRDAEDRVQAALTKLFRRHKDGTIALVVPEPLASLVRRCLARNELGDLWKASSHHGTWEVFEVEPNEPIPSH